MSEIRKKYYYSCDNTRDFTDLGKGTEFEPFNLISFNNKMDSFYVFDDSDSIFEKMVYLHEIGIKKIILEIIFFPNEFCNISSGDIIFKTDLGN